VEPDDRINLSKSTSGDIVPTGAGPAGESADFAAEGVDVGDFRQGTEGSRLALARYLVGRVVLDYLTYWFYLVAVLVLAVGGLAWWLVSPWLGVPIVIIGFGVLLVRAAFAKLVALVTGAAFFGPIEQRLMALVSDTGGDVRRELRRVGLPSHSWTLPLLPIRFIGRRRAETIRRIRQIQLERVVSASRVDELHLVLRDAGVLRRR
jgi:hypothetical protein